MFKQSNSKLRRANESNGAGSTLQFLRT